MKKIMLFAAACMALVACTKNIDTKTPKGGDAITFERGQKVTLSVNAGDQTKVSSELVTSGTDKDKVNFAWETGDKIKVTVGSESAEFTLSSGAGTASATFTGTMPAAGETFDVQYPVTDPDLSSQTYVANGLPKDKMKMAATGCTLGSDFTLNPQYAALRLNLWGGLTVSKIVVIKTETTDPSYTLNCGTGVVVGATKTDSTAFLIILPAGSFKFSAEVFDNAETPASIFNLETSAAKTFTAGQILNMPAKEVIDPSKYLCFTCTSGNVAIGMTKKGEAPDVNLQYYTCKNGWQDVKRGDGNKGVSDSTSIALASGEKVYFKAKTTNKAFASSTSKYNYFTTTTADDGKVDVSGNIMSLLDGSKPGTTMTSDNENALLNLFRNCSSIQNASKLSLPATTLANNCYYNMFYGCTSLTQAPTLPATTLAKKCYRSMFFKCTSLTQAPALPATTLADECYDTMFMKCTSLKTAPALNATELQKSCYYCMFQECTALTTAPALPATNLTESCYCYMFLDCTSLKTVPALNATTLQKECYYEMFSGCQKLSSVTMLATDVSASECLDKWLKDAGTESGSHTLFVDPTMLMNTTISDNKGNFTVTAYSGN